MGEVEKNSQVNEKILSDKIEEVKRFYEARVVEEERNYEKDKKMFKDLLDEERKNSDKDRLMFINAVKEVHERFALNKKISDEKIINFIQTDIEIQAKNEGFKFFV
jgi:hypothetical protein